MKIAFYLGMRCLTKLLAFQSSLKTALMAALLISLVTSATALARTTKTPAVGKRTPTAVETKTKLSEEQRKLRLQHAQELLGKYYQYSEVRTGEKVQRINGQVYRWTQEGLPSKHRHRYQEVAQAIIDESLRYEFDPILLLSVIQGESSFNPDMLGGVGEIGLMQIRPETGKWISQKSNMKWKGKKSLFDPVTNIRIGAAYLNFLRDRFDSHARLYLAAYNMGQRNVDSALSRNIWPKDYPIHVMRRYVDFYADLKEVTQKKEAKKAAQEKAANDRLEKVIDRMAKPLAKASNKKSVSL